MGKDHDGVDDYSIGPGNWFTDLGVHNILCLLLSRILDSVPATNSTSDDSFINRSIVPLCTEHR